MAEIEFIIRRHGEKSKGGELIDGRRLTGPNWLSPRGWQQAEAAGRLYERFLPTADPATLKKHGLKPEPGKKVILFRRTSPFLRTKQTALGIRRGAGSAVIHTPPQQDEAFGFVKMSDRKKWEASGAKHGEEGHTRLYLEGATDLGAEENWQQVGQRYFNGVRGIYRELSEQLKQPNVPKADKYVVDITTHGPGVGALASLLLGEKTRKTVRHHPEKFTEGVRIVIKDGKAKAIFRNRSRDITKLL